MDAFGPVTNSAQRIAELSGDVESEAAQALTKLDAIGNATKGIATAVLTATALFGSFRTSVKPTLTGRQPVHSHRTRPSINCPEPTSRPQAPA